MNELVLGILGSIFVGLVVIAILLSLSSSKKNTPARTRAGATNKADAEPTAPAEQKTMASTTTRTWHRVKSTGPISIGTAVLLGVVLLYFFWPTLALWLSALDPMDTPVGDTLAIYLGHTLANLLVWVVVAGALLALALALLGKGGTVTKAVSSIPFTAIGGLVLGAIVIIYIIAPITTGISNSIFRERDQEVTFPNVHANNAVGRRRTITVNPTEEWILRTGTIRGEHHPDAYWACATSNLDILQGRVFENRRLGYGRHQQRFSNEARVRLVQQGVTAVTITYVYQIGRPGRNSPCDQVSYVQ